MSTSQPFYFRDNGLRADPAVVPGNDGSSGSSDATAKRSYPELLRIYNTAPAGTDLFMCDSGGFRQDTSFMMRNTNSFTKINSITRVGNVATADISKDSNMTVGQTTTIRNLDRDEYNGLVVVTGVVNAGVNSSFTYNVTGNPPTPATSKRTIRFDGAMVSIKTYRSSLFTPVNPGMSPWCTYSDSSNRQHRFDNNGDFEGFLVDNVNYDYIGARTGTPSCFFTYNGIKSSVHVKRCIIQNYRTALDYNTKAADSQNYDARIIGNLIIDNYQQGWLGSSSESNIENNVWRNNGHNGGAGNNRSHNFYCSGSRANNIPFDPNFIVRDLVFRGNDVSQAAMNTGKAQGTEIVFHGQIDGVLIEDNYIHNTIAESNGGNYGIDITSGYNTQERLNNFTIRYNRIENAGNKLIALSALTNSLVELNTLVADAPISNRGISFIQERSTPGTVATDNVQVLNNYITGTNLGTDIDPAFGTNITVVRTNQPVPPPPGNDVTAPIVTPPVNITTEATSGLTVVAIGTATAVDDIDGVLTATSNAPASFPVGVTIVTWSATDAAGNTGTATQLVTITDQTPPIVTAPADITIQAIDANQVVVDIGQATAVDLVDQNLSVVSDAPLDYTPGTTTTVTWSAIDASGNVGADVQNITILDVVACVIQVRTTTEIIVNGIVTSTNQCLTNG